MAKIRVNHEECGEPSIQELPARQVTVEICNNTAEATYSFLCNVCGLMVLKTTEGKVIEDIVEAGAKVMCWDMPAELHEPKIGPPVAYDDLEEFHFGLYGPASDAAITNEMDRMADNFQKQARRDYPDFK